MTMNYDLCTNIPGNYTHVQFILSNIYTPKGITPHIRDKVIDIITAEELLEHYEGDNYHETTVAELILRAQDGRSSSLWIYEHKLGSDKMECPLQVYPDEKNQGTVENWINERMKNGIDFGFHLRFKAPTLSKYFPTKRPPQGTAIIPTQTHANTNANIVASIELPDLNTRGF